MPGDVLSTCTSLATVRGMRWNPRLRNHYATTSPWASRANVRTRACGPQAKRLRCLRQHRGNHARLRRSSTFVYRHLERWPQPTNGSAEIELVADYAVPQLTFASHIACLGPCAMRQVARRRGEQGLCGVHNNQRNNTRQRTGSTHVEDRRIEHVLSRAQHRMIFL